MPDTASTPGERGASRFYLAEDSRGEVNVWWAIDGIQDLALFARSDFPGLGFPDDAGDALWAHITAGLEAKS